MLTAQKVRPKHPYISSVKTHCGGSPIIGGTKFPVRSVVFYVLRQGMTPEELIKEFTHLTLPQVYDALSYYYENKKLIDRELREHEATTRSSSSSHFRGMRRESARSAYASAAGVFPPG